MEVSGNRGTPKSSILDWDFPLNHPAIGVPIIYGNPYIQQTSIPVGIGQRLRHQIWTSTSICWPPKYRGCFNTRWQLIEGLLACFENHTSILCTKKELPPVFFEPTKRFFCS